MYNAVRIENDGNRETLFLLVDNNRGTGSRECSRVSRVVSHTNAAEEMGDTFVSATSDPSDNRRDHA